LQKARDLAFKSKSEVIIYIADNINSKDKHEICRIVDFEGQIYGY
jgi:hypothetical protein